MDTESAWKLRERPRQGPRVGLEISLYLHVAQPLASLEAYAGPVQQNVGARRSVCGRLLACRRRLHFARVRESLEIAGIGRTRRAERPSRDPEGEAWRVPVAPVLHSFCSAQMFTPPDAGASSRRRPSADVAWTKHPKQTCVRGRTSGESSIPATCAIGLIASLKRPTASSYSNTSTMQKPFSVADPISKAGVTRAACCIPAIFGSGAWSCASSPIVRMIRTRAP
jgi:hypothetical protein